MFEHSETKHYLGVLERIYQDYSDSIVYHVHILFYDNDRYVFFGRICLTRIDTKHMRFFGFLTSQKYPLLIFRKVLLCV